MIALTLASLFAVVTFATLAALADCWLRARLAFRQFERERALVKAEFVRVVEAEELRLRSPARFAPLAKCRAAPRLPRHLMQAPRVPALGVA